MDAIESFERESHGLSNLSVQAMGFTPVAATALGTWASIAQAMISVPSAQRTGVLAQTELNAAAKRGRRAPRCRSEAGPEADAAPRPTSGATG